MKKSIYLTLSLSMAIAMTVWSQKVVVKTCPVCKKSLPECSYHGNHPKTPVLKGVKVIIPPIYGSIGWFKDGLAKYSAMGSYKYGFIDQQGKIVIPAKYKDISFYRFEKDGLCEVYQEWHAKGLIDKTGKVVVPLRYDDTYITLDGKRWLKQGENYFRLDKDGKIVPCKKYDNVYISRNSPFVKVCQNGKWGVVDGEETEIVPCTYDENSVKIGVYLIALRGEQGFAIYDSKGQKVNDGPYDSVSIERDMAFNNEDRSPNEVRFSSVKRNDYTGLIDQQTGKEVAPCFYSYMSSTVSEDGYRLVKRSGNYCYIDLEGHEIKHSGYNVEGFCCDGIIKAGKNGKWGYLTIDGKEVVDCVYESVSEFKFGYGVVRNHDKRGVVDSTGKVLFECKYDKVEIVDTGLAIAQSDKQYSVLNLDTQQEVPVDGGKLEYLGERLFDTSNGVLSSEGKTVVPADKYHWHNSFVDGLALVADKNWKWGAIDKYGNEVIPCQFTEEFHFDDGMAIVNVGGKQTYLWKHGVIAKPELPK